MLAAWYKKQMEIKAREEGRTEERKAREDWCRDAARGNIPRRGKWYVSGS